MDLGIIKRVIILSAAAAVAAAPALGGDLKITVVYDNNECDERLETAWGFACVVEGFEKRILFDTGGDGDVLLANMRALGYDAGDLDAIFLSHDHYDHVGGLARVLEANADLTVFMPASFPADFKEDVKGTGAAVVEVTAGRSICPGVYSTGEMGTSIVEQALVARTPRGLVVITGCAHPGIVDVVARVREASGDDVHLVMGGFHLRDAADAALRSVAASFREMGVRHIGPCHCSGDRAREVFAREFGARYVEVGAGTMLVPADLE
ncbi:MAG: MBL fold metallo-hydrolase [Candidatus Zixiibacteriota bacterium]|jgi:7,8-dihydropterin-6-yl-methyl-4-(beta-D-ribofuranosyl)aminobenzene 5'-phosphate synthase